MIASRPIRIAALALALASGCGDKPREPEPTPKQGTPEAVATLRGPFTGTLPCADCSGIQTELNLFVPRSPNSPGIYHLRQTYLATRDGDRTFTSMGRWEEQHGVAGDPKAILIVLDPYKSDQQKSFLQVSDDVLRLLDRSQAEAPSSKPQQLVRSAGTNPGVSLVAGEHASTVSLKVTQELIVQLPANRATGYTWVLADSTGGALAWQSTLYVQDSKTELAVGVGGNEYQRFGAVRSGVEDLQFEYRRPWEQTASPARTASVPVAVQ